MASGTTVPVGATHQTAYNDATRSVSPSGRSIVPLGRPDDPDQHLDP
jgi:hypothetical protein